MAVEGVAHVHDQGYQTGDGAGGKGLFPVFLGYLQEVGQHEGVLVTRPVAGYVAQAGGGGAGDGNGRHQQQQGLHCKGLEGFHDLAVAKQQFLSGLFAGFHSQLQFAQRAQEIVGQQQTAADNDDRGDPGDHVNDVQLKQGSKTYAQHFPKQLPAGLGEIFLGIVAFAALAVVIAVHNSSKHEFPSVVHEYTNYIITYNAQKTK